MRLEHCVQYTVSVHDSMAYTRAGNGGLVHVNYTLHVNMKCTEFSCPSRKVCQQTPVLDVLLIGSSLHRSSNSHPGCQASENSLELYSNLRVQQVRNCTDILSTLSHFSVCSAHNISLLQENGLREVP